MSRSLGFADFSTITDFQPSYRFAGHNLIPTSPFEDDPAASPLRKRYRRLAMAVLSRAISDAAGVAVVAADHPWTDDVDGREVMQAWLREETAGMTYPERMSHIRQLMIADARTFLLSPQHEADRQMWFRAAGVNYPGTARMKEIIASRRTMADETLAQMQKRGIFDVAV